MMDHLMRDLVMLMARMRRYARILHDYKGGIEYAGHRQG